MSGEPASTMLRGVRIDDGDECGDLDDQRSTCARGVGVADMADSAANASAGRGCDAASGLRR